MSVWNTFEDDKQSYKTISRFESISELQHYPTSDLDDIEAPFVEGIDHNSMLEEDLETRTHPEDKRIQTLNLYNVTFADAILAGALSANKRKKPDNAEERI